MLLRDFRSLIRRLWDDIPDEYRVGIAAVDVLPGARPHPGRQDVFTLGECQPLPGEAGPGDADLQSRIVLYHGSFEALARQAPGFDWVGEAWETLTHELRHHLEWKAQVGDLEEWDAAAEHNFARRDGERFDPLFYLAGEAIGDGGYRLDDDVFIDRQVTGRPEALTFTWAGGSYRIPVPPEATLPAYLVVEGVAEPPPGDLVVVLRRPPSLRGLLRRQTPSERVVTARRVE